jgi:hypothetical protein
MAKFDRVHPGHRKISPFLLVRLIRRSDVDIAIRWMTTIVQNSADNWQNFSTIAGRAVFSPFLSASHLNTAKLCFTVAVTVRVTLYLPAKMKIDFELTDFPWTRQTTVRGLLCTRVRTSGLRWKALMIAMTVARLLFFLYYAAQEIAKDVKIQLCRCRGHYWLYFPLGVFDLFDSRGEVGNSTNLTATEITTSSRLPTSPPATRPTYLPSRL